MATEPTGSWGWATPRVVRASFASPALAAPVLEVACGNEHTIFRLEDGTVMGCGLNIYGQLGHGLPSLYSPVRVEESAAVAGVYCAADYTCLLYEDGTIAVCGGNMSGQLGVGDCNHRYQLTPVPLPFPVDRGGLWRVPRLRALRTRSCGLW